MANSSKPLNSRQKAKLIARLEKIATTVQH